MIYTIDAKEKALGRTASEAAKILLGKNKAQFEPNKLSGQKVHITNASKIKMTDKKLISVFHERYSGYPGGIKMASIKEILGKKGYAELFRLAVYNMLPSNRSRSVIMKNLKISE